MTAIAFMWTTTSALVVCVFVTLLVKLYLVFSYFSKHNIPNAGPKTSTSSSMPLLLWDMYKKCGEHKIYGFFILWKPVILIKDLEVIKHVLVKSFSNFYNRGMYYDEKREPITGHLFALEGKAWKNLRTKLSPAFTSGRIKLMFPTVIRFSESIVSYIAEKPETELIECYKLMAKYTLSNIASTAFGVESDLFEENSEFMNMSMKFNIPSYALLFRTFLAFHLKGLCRFIPFKLIPSDVSSFFIELTKDAISLRENSDIKRDDFLQMLIQLKNNGSIDSDSFENDVLLTTNQMAAHTFLFILGGFESSAVSQSWALYELALNPDCQRRLQEEVDSVEDWTYEKIMELPYLDMVFSETLRKYPSVPFLLRSCNEDFKMPGNEGVIIEKGTDITISLWGLHRDPTLFPNPDKFDPERFGPNPPHKIQPYSYLPFGEGPRICIGLRFGKVQFKVGIATLMKHYTVEPSEKTTIPMPIHPHTFLATARDGIWLKFTRRAVQK